jgi:SAM-dependent methyltransferase
MRGPVAIARRMLRHPTQRYRAWRRSRGIVPGVLEGEGPDAYLQFRCNLCGACNREALRDLSREAATCWQCGSNVRFRAIAHLVTTEVLGTPLIMAEAPARKDIIGVGLSDADVYARPFARKFGYENTYYHKKPRLDICAVDDARAGRYDFVIASDVFEHVLPPVATAFVNARRLLKPGGKFIFTVPFSFDEDTREHYPDLHDWTLGERDGQWTLANTTRDGRAQEFRDLVFHGGPGSTLEMRVFSLAALEREFQAAGFSRMRVAAEPYLPFGIHWQMPWSVPMVAYN